MLLDSEKPGTKEFFPRIGPLLLQGYDYSRSGNPSRANFENVIASLEGAQYGVAFSSGSAVTASLLGTLEAGSHVVSVNDVYGGTYRYFTKVAVNHGVQVDFVDLADPQNLKSALKPNTRVSTHFPLE